MQRSPVPLARSSTRLPAGRARSRTARLRQRTSRRNEMIRFSRSYFGAIVWNMCRTVATLASPSSNSSVSHSRRPSSPGTGDRWRVGHVVEATPTPRPAWPSGSRPCRSASGPSRRRRRSPWAACSGRCGAPPPDGVRRRRPRGRHGAGRRRRPRCPSARSAGRRRRVVHGGMCLERRLDLLGEDLLAAGVDGDRVAPEQLDRCRRSSRRARSPGTE